MKRYGHYGGKAADITGLVAQLNKMNCTTTIDASIGTTAGQANIAAIGHTKIN